MTAGLDVATALNGTDSLVLGTDLFAGPVRPAEGPIPINAVFCLGSGGIDDEPFIGGGQIEQPSVQIRVRHTQSDYAGGLTRAKAVFAAIDKAAIAGYFDVRASSSAPIYLGRDGDQKSHEWSINVQLKAHT